MQYHHEWQGKFFLKHMFPKVPVLSFLCCDLLLLPNCIYKAAKKPSNMYIRISSQGLLYQATQQWTNSSLIY